MADPQQPYKENTYVPDSERMSAPGFSVDKSKEKVPTDIERQREHQEQPHAQEHAAQKQEKPTLRKFLPKKKKSPHIIPQVRDELTREVESIMEEGLTDAFKELSSLEQQEFKIKGEQTAIEIRNMLRGAHVRVKSIFKLLLEWLKLLPGVNRFFLEQEAKIKAERILSLRKRGR